MSKKTIPYTKHGYTMLQKEYDELMQTRKSAVEELSRARDMGDRSENAAYKSARQNLSRIDSKSRHLQRLIQFGYIYSPSTTEKVDIGCFVTVDSGTAHATYEIVGEYEADPLKGKLSYKSPVGHSLLRKRVHDTAQVLTPAGPKSFRILSLDWQ